MDISVKTFLKDGDKKVTIFQASTAEERESAMLALRQRVKEYTMELKTNYQEFIEEHNPFVRIIIEGLTDR